MPSKAVARVLHEHFVKEEQVALPPLGLLSTLARHQVDEVLKRSFLFLID